MIRTTTQPMDGLQIEACVTKKLQGGESKLIVPNNCVEVFIPFDSDIKMRKIGSPRIYELTENEIYLFAPRSRGAHFEVHKDAQYVLRSQSLLSVKNLGVTLKPIGNGIYKLELCVEERNSVLDSLRAGDAADLEGLLFGLLPQDSLNETILNSVEMIQSANGSITIKKIYESLDISKSKLEQHFNREVGLTPKEFCRIEKLNHFIKSYNDFPELSLTELTYLGGYYDQSHLIKDFNYFLGMSPKKFFDSMAKV